MLIPKNPRFFDYSTGIFYDTILNMNSNPNSSPNTRIRRKDRAVEDERWIKDFLIRAPFGQLAMAIGEQPYIKNILFAYDERVNAIYIPGATRGRTPETIRSNPRVGFTVAEMGRLLPADSASEVSVEYASVVVFGQARILEGEYERAYGLQSLMDKYFPHLRPGEHYAPVDKGQMAGTAVYCIEIQEWSGKREQADSDFPGAYTYDELDFLQ